MSGRNNIWMSVSDLMTGLMVIFMFISIAYILKVQQAEKQKENIVTQYKDTKNAIYNELTSSFKDEFKQWNMELDKNLSIRFTNANVMFDVGQEDISPEFAKILDKFFPKYFDLLLQDKYKNSIKEIRIEGHTDNRPIAGYEDSYMANISLSQRRAAKVLEYFRNSGYYKNLKDNKQELLQYWITANGFSFGRSLDNDKNETFITGKEINDDYSRRVEFKIITNSEELIERIVETIE